ncbi:MAG: hypothetical protein H0X37_26815 [Herpetosiphonaceae bacterium]|nr:hypothetical protein [Herpetosiphonaceae bacterium]
MKRLTTMRLLGLVFLLALLGSATATAQQIDRKEAVVYGINAAVPDGYVGTFAPPSAPALYLLAQQISVISLRKTFIYFWPITNEYQADWEVLNQEITGNLEISRNGEVVQRVAPTDYSIQYTPQKLTQASARLFVGPEAVKAQSDFVGRQQAYQKASTDYYAAEQAWLAAMDEFQAKNSNDAPAKATPPPEPVQPAPISIYSNGLNRGFPLKLNPGNYTILIRDTQGKLVPQSERSLTVFTPRRTAVGYTVVPETRWTTPDQVNDQADVVLGKGGSNLYLEPLVIREYPQRAYAFLQNPQYLGNDTADWTWVNGEAIKGATLEITGADQAIDRRSLTPYKVNQLSGQALGYEVVKFTPSTGGSADPDFEAYPVNLKPSQSSYTVRLLGPDGRLIPDSTRLVRVPATVALSTLLLLPLLPLLGGAIILSRRRLRMRMPRNIAK